MSEPDYKALFLEAVEFLRERQWDFEEDGRGENNICRECGWSRRGTREQFLGHKEGCRLKAITAAAEAVSHE